MNRQTEKWTTGDGLQLHAQLWDTIHPKAVIALVHGLGEHVGRYEQFAAFFNQQGYAVLGADRRGHGKSEGPRGHAASFDALLSEVSLLLEKADTHFHGKAVFLYGHSMGGALVLAELLRRKPAVQGVIASAPWIALTQKPPAIKVAAGKLVYRLLPTLSLPNGLDPKYISTDPAEVEAYINDPLIHDKISAATGVHMLEASDWLNKYAGTIDTPLLIMHGAADQVTSPVASAGLAERLEGDVTFQEWPGLYHEIHQEPNKDEVMRFALDWMDARL